MLTSRDVNSALSDLVAGAGATLSKNHACALVVTFAEGSRFDGMKDVACEEGTAGVAVRQG